MKSHRTIRMQGIGLLLVGLAALALPRPARATESPDCGVCYQTYSCTGSDPDDCNTYCDGGTPSSCVQGILGGWTCEGSGVYDSFVYCQ